jgi:dTDP-4-amino-4,6-dideoxygalactose transaminase
MRASTPGISVAVPFMDLRRHHEPLADELRAAFERVLGASAFIQGAEVDSFEQRFAQLCEVDHCVAVGSGTAALLIMLRAAGIRPGDEVIVPSQTFIATAVSVLHVGATPVCADVQHGTGLIDPKAVAAAISPRTAAVVAVHLFGQACAIDELRALTDRHGLLLLEDAAQAHGATHRGRPVGGLGDAASFSFYPSKNLGALGEGGAICTNDAALAATARALRNHGSSPELEHGLLGYNERMHGLQAAFLQVKLGHLAQWTDSRRRIAAIYRGALTELELLDERPETPCVYHLFPIRLGDRDGAASRLKAAGIGTGVHYPRSIPDQPALAELAACDAPEGRDWAARELSLPMFPELTDPEIESVVTTVKSVLTTINEATL